MHRSRWYEVRHAGKLTFRDIELPFRGCFKKLDDCFGQFLVRVICDCGACREIEPEALARLVGWKVTLKEIALRMRCSRCGKKAAEVVAVARPGPRGVPKNPE
jgi:hypothetical protein